MYDLIVIGAGSGGVRAARMAASTGAKVAVIEDKYLGGTCVNVGCVPKKLFVYASEYVEQLHDAKGFGVHAALESFQWEELRDNKTNEISRLNGIYNNILEGSGAEVLLGRGKVISPDSVQLTDAEGNQTQYQTKRILIATGGWPFKPNIPGIEHSIDSNQVFDLEAFPKEAVVVGGGYIAVEFAGIFKGLGADVKMLYRSERILKDFDKEIAEYVHQEISKKGVEVQTNTDITEIQLLENGRKLCKLNNGTHIETDLVFYATGRKANSQGLGLEDIGVELKPNGAIAADPYDFSTNIEGLYALGDVIGTPALTPVALEQGMVFVDQQFGTGERKVDYDLIPTAVFCQPNVGTVGISEEQATEKFPNDVDVYTSEFKALKHTLSGSNERTLMKLVVQRSTDKVLGVHLVGEHAGEVLQGFAVAMQAGATKAHFDQTLGIHPTGAEEFVTMRSVARSY